MKTNKNWACPLFAAMLGSILILYGHWIPANIVLLIGTRGLIDLMDENDVNVSTLREMRT